MKRGRGRGKRDGGEVLFADQVGVRSDQVAGRTWDEKGRTPVVRRSGGRFSVNTMSATSTKGVNGNRTSSVATAAAHTSATSWTSGPTSA